MLDAPLRRFIDPPLDAAGQRLAAIGLSANAVTLGGFGVGLMAVPLLAVGAYDWALVAILVNRLADGVDGAIARAVGASDFGGYLDIVCDFLFYAAVVFGFVLAAPGNRLPGAFLLFAFIGTGSSFLAFAALAARRGLETRARGLKSLYYLGGLTEGSETILLFVLCCFFPNGFGLLAWIFGVGCWLTVMGRVLAARDLLSRPAR